MSEGECSPRGCGCSTPASALWTPWPGVSPRRAVTILVMKFAHSVSLGWPRTISLTAIAAASRPRGRASAAARATWAPTKPRLPAPATPAAKPAQCGRPLVGCGLPHVRPSLLTRVVPELVVGYLAGDLPGLLYGAAAPCPGNHETSVRPPRPRGRGQFGRRVKIFAVLPADDHGRCFQASRKATYWVFQSSASWRARFGIEVRTKPWCRLGGSSPSRRSL